MVRIAWRSLTSHKLRTFLTTLAILLGVAMISGTYVLTDQIDRGFKQVFTDAYKGTDVTVTRQARFSGQLTGATAGLPESLVKQVQAVDGVAAVFGYVTGQRRGGRGRQGRRDRRLADAVLLLLAQRHRAAAVRRGRARRSSRARSPSSRSSPRTRSSRRRLADQVITAERRAEATVSGVFTFAAQSSLGGSLIIHTTLSDAQRWFDMQGRVSEIDVKAAAGVSPDTLARRVRAVVPQYARSRPARRPRPTRPRRSATPSARSSSRRCSASAASPCWSAPSSSSTRSR